MILVIWCVSMKMANRVLCSECIFCVLFNKKTELVFYENRLDERNPELKRGLCIPFADKCFEGKEKRLKPIGQIVRTRN